MVTESNEFYSLASEITLLCRLASVLLGWLHSCRDREVPMNDLLCFQLDHFATR
jgi:hypothetical protein